MERWRERFDLMQRYGFEANRVLRRLVLVVLAAWGVTSAGLLQPPIYEASAKLIVSWQQGDEYWANMAGSGEQLQTLEYRSDPPTETIMYAIASRSVAREVIQRLNLQMEPDELLDNLTVEQVALTSFIDLTYEDTNPAKAKKIANTVGQVSAELVSDRSNEVSLVVWERAKDTTDPVSRPYRNGLVTLIAGLVLAVVLAGMPRSLTAGTAQIAHGLMEGSKVRVGQALTVARTRLAGGRRAALREAEAVKEQELLEALDRCGRLTAVEAAMQTTLTVQEAEQMLSDLRDQGQLQFDIEHGARVYSFWKAEGA